MIKEHYILRKLAYQYLEIARSQRNSDNIKLQKSVNDLKQIRPVVLIDEIPWNEMNIDDELTVINKDPVLRDIEWLFRTTIYKNKYMPADMVVSPFVPIYKVIRSTDIGVTVNEEILSTDKSSYIVSHKYEDMLSTEEDLDKLHDPVITYDKEETLRRYELVGDIIGDIIPVKVTGIGYFGTGPWDEISVLRGVTNLLIDLAERPEFMHRMVRKLTDISLSRLKQYEDLDLLDIDTYSLHSTPILTDDLPGSFTDNKITRKNVWGRGYAQIFASVSKQMHYDFDIKYMIESVGQCGLVYYGCCEPLDKKIDIVEKIPNLRKISVTPWADVNVAAEAINTRYVLSSKPNPASVAVPKLNEEALRAEIKTILDACKRNNCSADIVLKDISTCCGRPQNIFEWERIVMEMVNNF